MIALRRIGRDLKHRRHVEIYVVAAASIVLAACSLVGDLLGDDLRWATVFAALALLTYQLSLPDQSGDLDAALHGRASFDETTFASRVRRAREIWIQAPSAANLLTADTTDLLRRCVLARPEGVVRVMVLDPSADTAVTLAAQQLDDATDYLAVELPRAISTTVDRLEMMAAWSLSGTFHYRYLGFNPGFSSVAIDPHSRDGLLIVEFHGVHNESTASRMHIELTRSGSERWYVYWRDQLEHLWHDARSPEVAPPKVGA
jgi:hypothetical protein